MGLKGFFKADREEYHLSEPILVTLVIKNETDHEIYLFVPRGRADGIRITVKEGKNFQIKGMREEPEVGLVPEERLLSGEIYRQQYQLTRWLTLKEPGYYRVECGIEIESYNVSISQKNLDRVATKVAISTDIHFNILP